MVAEIKRDEVIGRFAPTPSGALHFGSLVAALASFLSAKRQGGQWLVRMEDVDRLRCIPGADARILRQLEMYGLHWDGAVLYQSTRSEAYRAARDWLLREDLAYACTCSRTQIRAQATRFNAEGAIYPGTCRTQRKSWHTGGAVRLDVAAVQGGAVVGVQDRLCGTHVWDVVEAFGDFVLWRADDLAAYHLAVVVDDAAQGVTEVVRGADLLDSTPRHLVLQRALGLPMPIYAHVPLALAANGQKLSKQNLAPELPLTSPELDLWDALVFLGEAPPKELYGAPVATLLAWALARSTRSMGTSA